MPCDHDSLNFNGGVSMSNGLCFVVFSFTPKIVKGKKHQIVTIFFCRFPKKCAARPINQCESLSQNSR